MNSIGVPGASSTNAVSARTSGIGVSSVTRSPVSEFATWSWFCRKVTNASGGTSSAGDPRRRGLPRVALTLVQEPSPRGGDELVRGPEVVAVIGLAQARQRDHGRVVKVVVPDRVHPEAAGLGRPDQSRVLRLVLRDDEGRATRARAADLARDRGQDVLVGVVEDLLRRIEPKPVEVVLVDPHAHVPQDELAHGRGPVLVEVEDVAPIAPMAAAQVPIPEQREVAAVGAEVVVDHIEDHRDPQRMGTVDECTQVVRAAVEPRRGEEVDAVVSPAEIGRESRPAAAARSP